MLRSIKIEATGGGTGYVMRFYGSTPVSMVWGHVME